MAGQHQHRLFFHPQYGWRATPEGAVRRVDARTRSRTTTDSQNLLFENVDGAWQPVPSTAGLSGRDRGWVWYARRTEVRGRPYVAFKGVVVVDRDVASLFDQLTPYDESAAPIDGPMFGHTFLLSPEQATVFARRVVSADGDILRAGAVPDAAEEAVASIELCAYEMEELAELDRRALDDARQQSFSAALTHEFEQRGVLFRDRLQAADAAMRECEQAINVQLAHTSSVAERAATEAVLQAGRDALRQCQALLEARAADERAIAQLMAQASGIVDGSRPAAARRLLFRELGEIAAEQGLPVQDTPDGVRVRTRYGWLRLGPGFDFEA
jgi:hypothetical protein